MDMGLFAKFVLLFTTFKATTLFETGEGGKHPVYGTCIFP